MVKYIRSAYSFLRRRFKSELLRQEALLRLALEEEGINWKRLKIEIDHVNGINKINGNIFPIIYPRSFFDKIALFSERKDIDFYFNGNMNDAGDRKKLLYPYTILKDNVVDITESNYGRQASNKFSFNEQYYLGLTRAKFGLCPHQADFVGNKNTMWTYRFIECCMAECIPIVFDETPLGIEFTTGFYFESNQTLPKDLIYRKSKALHNFELCRERFSFISNSDYKKILDSLL